MTSLPLANHYAPWSPYSLLDAQASTGSSNPRPRPSTIHPPVDPSTVPHTAPPATRRPRPTAGDQAAGAHSFTTRLAASSSPFAVVASSPAAAKLGLSVLCWTVLLSIQCEKERRVCQFDRKCVLYYGPGMLCTTERRHYSPRMAMSFGK